MKVFWRLASSSLGIGGSLLELNLVLGPWAFFLGPFIIADMWLPTMSICQDVWSFMVNLPFLAIVCPGTWHRLLKPDLNCWFWNRSCLDWVCNCYSANLQFSMFLILEHNELFQVHEKLGGISMQLPLRKLCSCLSEAVLSQSFSDGSLDVCRKLLDCLAVKSQLSTQQCSNAKLKPPASATESESMTMSLFWHPAATIPKKDTHLTSGEGSYSLYFGLTIK